MLFVFLLLFSPRKTQLGQAQLLLCYCNSLFFQAPRQSWFTSVEIKQVILLKLVAALFRVSSLAAVVAVSSAFSALEQW